MKGKAGRKRPNRGSYSVDSEANRFNFCQAQMTALEVLQLEGQLRGDVETRMSLGLNADVEYVRNLRGSAEDVGSDLFNVPMTQAELNEMQGRWDFANATRDTVMPYVRELPTFAGAYYDHSSNGDLIILLTAADADVRNEISSLAPAGRDTRVEIVDYTQSELRESIGRIVTLL